jgi:hypothetical protein
MRSRVLGPAAFFVSFLLLAAAAAHAQGQQSPTPSKPRPVAHDFFTWLHNVTGAGTHRHRIVSAPPLPRPRPAHLEQPTAAVEPNNAATVQRADIPD